MRIKSINRPRLISGAKLQKEMYLGKRKIHNIQEYEKHRAECIQYKEDAVFTAFSELDGLISKAALAEQYFEKSKSWLSQRMNNCMVRGKTAKFREEDFCTMAEAFRDIAKRLQAHADEIDKAMMENNN